MQSQGILLSHLVVYVHATKPCRSLQVPQLTARWAVLYQVRSYSNAVPLKLGGLSRDLICSVLRVCVLGVCGVLGVCIVLEVCSVLGVCSVLRVL